MMVCCAMLFFQVTSHAVGYYLYANIKTISATII